MYGLIVDKNHFVSNKTGKDCYHFIWSQRVLDYDNPERDTFRLQKSKDSGWQIISQSYCPRELYEQLEVGKCYHIEFHCEPGSTKSSAYRLMDEVESAAEDESWAETRKYLIDRYCNK